MYGEKILRKNLFLKVRNSLLELEKDFIELKDITVKIRREIKELAFRPIIVTIDNMDMFGKRHGENKTN